MFIRYKYQISIINREGSRSELQNFEFKSVHFLRYRTKDKHGSENNAMIVLCKRSAKMCSRIQFNLSVSRGASYFEVYFL
jgi:hypothetical protein